MKQIRFLIEALFLYFFYGFFSLLPPAVASNLGGGLLRLIGPHLGASRKAMRNLEMVFPDMPPEEKKKIIREMWENAGRVLAEYPHLEKIGKYRVTVLNMDIVRDTMDKGTGAIFISGHVGNWEINAAAMLMQLNQPMNLTYRALNNPYADRLLARARTLKGRIQAFPKSRSSGKDLMTALKNKEYLGILIDQKYNEGLAVPFFGIPAMTNPIFAALSQKYKVPVIPVYNRRVGAARFEITVQKPLDVFDSAGQPLPVENILNAANKSLEEWIRQHPSHWIWLHRRWDSEKLRA